MFKKLLQLKAFSNYIKEQPQQQQNPAQGKSKSSNAIMLI